MRRFISHMVRPGITVKPATEHDVVQTVQVNHNQFDTREIISAQNVGFHNSLPAGTHVVTVNVAGDNSNGVVIASNHNQFRPKDTAPGETMVYDCGKTQQFIYLKSDGSVQVHGFHNVQISGDTLVTITAPNTRVEGNLTVTGFITAGEGTSGNEVTVNGNLNVSGEVRAKAGGQSVALSTHTHAVHGNQTNPPDPNT